MLTEKLFDKEKIVINFADGENSMPPLVMLHGLTQNWQTFREFIPSINQNWHIYACDLPGHGKSGRSLTGYRAIDYVSAISDFIEQYIGQPIVLLGFSIGAVVTLGIAARLPDLIRAIVVLDPVLMNRDVRYKQMVPQNDYISWVNEVLSSKSSIEELAARCKEREPALTDVDALGKAKRLRSIELESVHYLLNDRLFENFSLDQELSKIACPAILIHGDAVLGGMVRDQDVAFLKAHVPQITTYKIEGYGHEIIWGTAGKMTLAHITQFLESL